MLHVFSDVGGSTVRPLSWDTRLKVMIGAARGLNFLHSLEKKIIYRDFKPSNILLDKVNFIFCPLNFPGQFHVGCGRPKHNLSHLPGLRTSYASIGRAYPGIEFPMITFSLLKTERHKSFINLWLLKNSLECKINSLKFCACPQAYTAKLSDFGLAKSGPSSDHTHVSTQVVGTHGYAAPEYIATGNVCRFPLHPFLNLS